MAKQKTEVTFEVKEKLGVISQNGTVSTELRLVSWNGDEPKYDIRPWWEDDKGIEKCGKGLRLTLEDLKNLDAIIQKL